MIEIDGGYHDDIRQQYHDQARTNEIEKLGFNVIRFTNEDIFTRLDEVIDIIKNKRSLVMTRLGSYSDFVYEQINITLHMRRY